MKRRLSLAIVGRPNVGKSAIFNRISKKRIAIVDEAEGVTRDRIYATADFFGKTIDVIDTGGIDPKASHSFQEEIRRQAEIAIEEADALVMVVDGQIGITDLDETVARILLRTGKPVCLAVNKIDSYDSQHLLHNFYSLGIRKMVPVSALHGFRIAELLEAAFEGSNFPEEEEEEESSTPRVAIVGRPNVGKSTLLNRILGEERCVVSPIAGTTRDSIDAQIHINNTTWTLIDTAGIRRKNKESEAVDKFAFIRTERAIERSDLCLLILDAERGLTVQDKKIANTIEEMGKGCILLFNKWDLVKGYRMEHCLRSVREQVPFLAHCPTLFISAKTGRNVQDLFGHMEHVYEAMKTRITTGQLNKFIERVVQKYHPPMIQGRRLRIYYMAQVGIQPPHFVLFVNVPELMEETYKKYMINQFREQYGFTGVPLTFTLRGRKERASSSAQQAPQPISQEALDAESAEAEEEVLAALEKDLDSSYWE